MTLGRTARDVSPRELLPLIARYLQDHGLANPIRKLPLKESEIASFEPKVLEQLANLLHQLYLHPCLNIPGFAVRSGSSRCECGLLKRLHRHYVDRLIAVGWIVKDSTGIFYLSDAVCGKFDELANSIRE
jgi:hypothetical protein